MSAPTTDIREIFTRIECGICGVSEAAVLKGLVADLVWIGKASKNITPTAFYEECRHCGIVRGSKHKAGCIAREVE